MENPLISVIVPVYGVEAYLDECVQSIVQQTYRNLEIILVDDGSPDNCPIMCDDWAKKDSRIKVIHQKNAGQSAARNAGLKIAKGDYIGFVDSDDFIDSNMYETLMQSLIASPYKIATCYFVRTAGDIPKNPFEEKAEKSYSANEALNEFFLKREIGSAVWDKLFKKELFDDIRFPEGETNEEYPMFIPLIINSDGIVHTGKILYYYRMRSDSTTDTTWKTDAGIVFKHLNQMQEQINRYGLKDNQKSFNVFCADSAYSTVLQLDKNYNRINETAKKNHKKYLRVMRKHLFALLSSRDICIKDKILYLMVVTRTLRPIYKMLGRL